MSLPATQDADLKEPFTPQVALRRAWVWYLVYLSLPIVMLVFHGWARLAGLDPALDPARARTAFIGNLFWVGLSGSAGFLAQEWYFRRYYTGTGVSPRNYLRGKLVAWTLLISGAFIAATLTWLTQALFPHLFALIVVYGFMFTQYPHGRAMTHEHGDKDRAELYAEPK